MVLWCVISSCKVTETVWVSQSIWRTTKQGRLRLIIHLSFIEIRMVHTHMHEHICKHAHTKQSTHGRRGTKSFSGRDKNFMFGGWDEFPFSLRTCWFGSSQGSNNTNKEKRIRLLLDRGAPLPTHQGWSGCDRTGCSRGRSSPGLCLGERISRKSAP